MVIMNGVGSGGGNVGRTEVGMEVVIEVGTEVAERSVLYRIKLS